MNFNLGQGNKSCFRKEIEKIVLCGVCLSISFIRFILLELTELCGLYRDVRDVTRDNFHFKHEP